MKTVHSIEELLKLKAAERKVDVFRPAIKYQFEVPELTPEENKQLGVMINSYGAECGCNTGQLLMIFGFTILVTLYFSRGGSFATLCWHSWLVFFCWLVGFAFVGKVVGLVWARWKMHRLIDRTLPKLNLARMGAAAHQH
jgi:hypothetical protein